MSNIKGRCTYHCRSCNCHFTSLVAFDLHRKHWKCLDSFPKDKLIGKKGECKIGDPDNPVDDVIIYELPATAAYRKMRSEQS